MKRFRFPLNGLARLREQQVRQQQVKLAEASGHLKEAIEVREKIAQQLQLTVESTATDAEWSVRDRMSLDRDQEELRRAISFANRTIGDEHRKVAEERERLIAVERDREVLSRLREEQHREYLRDLLRHEQQEMDDLVIQRYGKDNSA